jgi:hypothetical protein
VFNLSEIIEDFDFLRAGSVAAMAEELEIGIAPAVLSSSGYRNLSSDFSRRNNATSVGRTANNFARAEQNLSGVWACSKTNSTERLGARPAAVAELPDELLNCLSMISSTVIRESMFRD